MKMYSAFLGLGSNLGDRHVFLNRAVAELKKLPDTRLVWASSVYETDPVGKADQPKFLNAAVEVETALAPAGLLQETAAIEQRLGRSTSERWGPREIDIDVLLYDGVVQNDGNVRVPHPELEKRKFVLVPLHEIAPDVVHPVNGMTVEEMLRACRDSSRVVRSAFKLLL